MKQSTIDEIIETFDDLYTMKSHALYYKYKSVDKFVEVSYYYAMGLQADNFEKEIFMSYFENHVKSMYRRDFENDKLELEKKGILSDNQRHLITASWGAIFGTVGSLIGYVATKSPAGAATGATLGVIAGAYLADKGLKESAQKENILGTGEYEKNIRNKLYSSLSDN